MWSRSFLAWHRRRAELLVGEVLVGGEHGNTSGVRKHGIKAKEVALNVWLTGGSKDGSGEGCGGGIDVPVVLSDLGSTARPAW